MEEVPRKAAHERYPALDGLRALAIGGVLAYHLGWAALPGGYLGVDLFFVLSGFLITRLLLAERLATGSVRLRAFWGRRAKRLLPGLFLVLGALAVAAIVVPSVLDPSRLQGDGLAALFYYANWHFLLAHQSYFGQVGLPSPLEHTWTLSIEEQFYLLWPLVLSGLAALAGRRGRAGRELAASLLVPVGLLAAGSLVAMTLVYDGGKGLEAAYFGTECRAFELLFGALAALWLESRPAGGPLGRPGRSRLVAALGLAGLAGVLAAMALITPGRFAFSGGIGLVDLGAVLLVLACLVAGPVRALFSLSPLRLVGQASYEIYLWHWPVIVFCEGELHLAGAARVIFVLGVTGLLAFGSYFLVDRPLRRASYASLRRRLLLPGAVAATCALVVAAVPLGTAAAAPGEPRLGRVAAGHETSSAVFGVRLPPPVGRLDLGFAPSRQRRVRVMFIGDSVMYQLELAVGAALAATGEARTVQDGAILGWSPRGGSDFARLRAEVARSRPDLVVAMWTQDNEWVARHGVAAYEKAVLSPLLSLFLGKKSSVRGVVFVAQPPQPPPDSWMPDVHADVYDPPGMALWEKAARAEAAAHPGRIAFVPATEMLELDGHYTSFLPTPGGRIARVRQVDDFHLCLNGGVRYGAGAAAGLVRLLSLSPPRANWWLGPFAKARRWYELPGFPPGMCPSDAPASLATSGS